MGKYILGASSFKFVLKTFLLKEAYYAFSYELILSKLTNEVRRKSSQIEHLKEELARTKKSLEELRKKFGDGNAPTAHLSDLQKLQDRIKELEAQVASLKRNVKDVSASRDIYKTELDNLTFEYDKLTRENRKYKEKITKLEGKLKKNMSEYLIIQQEKATLEEEKKAVYVSMMKQKETQMEEINKISKEKSRIEHRLLLAQTKTAQVVFDWEAHRQLVRSVGRIYEFQIRCGYQRLAL